MAIQNASDLLVYRNASAATQVTKITVADSPLSGNGFILVDNLTNDSGVTSNNVRIPPTGSALNTSEQVALAIKNVLQSTTYDYNCTVLSTGVLEVTNGATGFVPTISFKSGNVGIDDGGITVEVTTQGSDAGYTPVAFSTSASLSINNEVRDTTNKDSNSFSQAEPGLLNFELSTDALQDFDTDVDFQEFFNDIKDTSSVTLRFAQRNTSSGTDVYYQAEAFISSLSLDAGVEDNTTYSATFTGTSIITEGTY